MADLDEYVISVKHDEEAVVVVFSDRETVDLLKAGGGGRIPEFAIELDKDYLQFVRLTYTR